MLIGFAGIVIFALLMIALARGVSRPLAVAAAAMEEVTCGGDLTHRVKVVGKDELSRLSQAFNTFAESV